MDVSKKTFRIRENPSFIEERIIADFTSGGIPFHEIAVFYDDEYGFEVYYVHRYDHSQTVLAYANGVWEIEYRYITFEDNVTLNDDDAVALQATYEAYIPTRTLNVIYGGVKKKAVLNGIKKGHIFYSGDNLPWDNWEYWQTPTITLAGDILSTEKVEGVTKYKVYSNGSYIGYVDENNEWHGGAE